MFCSLDEQIDGHSRSATHPHAHRKLGHVLFCSLYELSRWLNKPKPHDENMGTYSHFVHTPIKIRRDDAYTPLRHTSITFHSMDVRRRIAALALFGVQLLQGVLPAAGAACERPAVVETIARVSQSTDPHQHHDTPMPVEHSHAPAACPMAMACTVVGVMGLVVAVTTVDVDVDVHRPLHVADWPVSLDIAPEPPPPRS